MTYWIVPLAAAILAPAVISLLLTLIEKKTRFSALPSIYRQLIIGLIFGAVAIITTRHGVEINGATTYVRNAASLTAGLLFGAPAGILAGLVGAVGCWRTMLQSSGMLTALADSISVLLAGLAAGCLRVYMFDDKKPTWFYGLAIAIVMEDIHMMLLFLFDISVIHSALELASRIFLPTVTINSLSVTLAVMAVSLLLRRKGGGKAGMANIAQRFQRWLLLCVSGAFLVTIVFTLGIQNRLSQNDARSLLKINLEDLRDEISYTSDKNLLALTHTIAGHLDESEDVDDELLTNLAQEYNVSEVSVIDVRGFITHTTNPMFRGYDMAYGEQSAEFLCLLSGESEYVSSYKPISYDASMSRKYAGVTLARGGFVQVGYDAERFQQDIDTDVVGLTRFRHLDRSGFILICNESGLIVSDSHGNEGRPLSSAGITQDALTAAEGEVFTAQLFGSQCICMYSTTEGYTIIAAMPETEALFSRNVAVYMLTLMEIITFATVFAMVYFLVKKIVVENIHRINGTLSRIAKGDLNVTVDVRSNAEFSSLSDDINSTVNTLKRYIAEAEARIDAELEFSRVIQLASLPSVFPPYPSRNEFDIYAGMYAAKEVGGDFYDFFFVNNDTLAFLVADVSGKGIPAAMFMMTAKALIKGSAEAGMDADAVFDYANQKLCEGNEAKMFVTAWMGMIDLRTGLTRFVNAGHNPPLLRRRDGSFEYLTERSGIMLAMRKKSAYAGKELHLEPGDQLFLYTDGVTEATDAENRLYGDARLQALLNGCGDMDAQELCETVKADIDLFVGDAPQFDDITMLSLRYIARMGEEQQ